jgi:membrane fusion protein, adhesin transport system
MTSSSDIATSAAAERRSRRQLWLLLGLIALLLLWAATAPLTVVSLARGEVKPQGQVKRVQHLEGGIIQQILVREGEQVVAGQILLELETIRHRTELDELHVSLRTLEIEAQRLEAELQQHTSLQFAPLLRQQEPALVSEAEALFMLRRQRLAQEITVQRDLIERHQQQIRQLTARRHSNEESLKLLDEQISIHERLQERNLANRLQQIELLKERSRLHGQLAEDEAQQAGLLAAINEAENRIHLLRITFAEEARRNLQEALRSQRLLVQRQQQLEDALHRTALRAPVDGIIKQLWVRSRGEVITAGATIVEIVPIDDRLMIEARLESGEAAWVAPGQLAQVRLSARDGQRLPPIAAVVSEISPDTLVGEEGTPFYRVRLLPQQGHFEHPQGAIMLQSGLLVECAIITGERTLLDYLLAPLQGGVARALRER